MGWCAAVGCNNNSFKKNRDTTVTFFRLPKDSNLKKKWLNNMKRANLPKEANVRVCQAHFEESCFKRDLQNELLNKPTRKLLKDDAAPTLFEHNTDKQIQKRKSSIQREEQATKKQLCEDAITHHSNWEKLEREINTKEVQTDITIFSTASTQTSLVETLDKETQTEDREQEFFMSKRNNMEIFEEDFDDISSVYEPDSSFCEQDEYSDSEDSENETLEIPNTNTNAQAPSKSCFLVYWSSLVILLCRCLTCGLLASITKCTIRGSLIIVEIICIKSHKNIWRSQPQLNGSAHGNIKFSAAVLFSANTFMKLSKYFELADIQWISKTRFYDIQKKYLAGVVNEFWLRERNCAISELRNSDIRKLCGDGRCDSPGHNAKYLTYSMLNQANNKIVDMSVVQVTEAGNSNRMEKLAFKRVLNNLQNDNVTIDQIATDRHIQIRKYMREEKPNIKHQFDVWHFCKNIKSKLLAASKADSKAFEALQSIVLNKSVLNDLKHLTEFSHTGNLEVYHSLYNKWIPKSQHFSHLGMITRSQLAILDYNQGSSLGHATTKSGEKRYNISFSKITKTWSAKPIKEVKQREYLKDMIERTLEAFSQNLTLEMPILPQNLPKNIAATPKPNKNEVINNQRSRFNK